MIEHAWEGAIARLTADATVVDAVRDGLLLDKDTKGIPRSPSIIDTIFAKIDQAPVFGPDLNYVGARGQNGMTPNPNVLAYGWALKSRGRSRIVAVMNDANGISEQLFCDVVIASFVATEHREQAAR